MVHRIIEADDSGWFTFIWDPSWQRRRWLRTFPTAKMAAKAYDDAAAKLLDSTKMVNPENIPSCDVKPSRLTRDQEHVIMVSALRQVISNDRGDNSSTNAVAFESLHQPFDAGPCPLCNITGCSGCAFPVHVEIDKEKKHKGVRQKPS
ncbi:hypothetical protein IGI04_013262, partial [Brassica rapa subsp. trilocularis]